MLSMNLPDQQPVELASASVRTSRLPNALLALLIAGALLGGTLAVIVVPALFDEAPIDDSDLLPLPRATIPDEENGAMPLLIAEEELTGVDGGSTLDGLEERLYKSERDESGQASDQETSQLWAQIDATIKQHSSTLDDIDRGLAKENFQLPTVEDEICNFEHIRSLLVLDGRRQLEFGRVDLVMVSVRRLLLLSTRIGTAARCQLHIAISLGLRRSALELTRRIARHAASTAIDKELCDAALRLVADGWRTEMSDAYREEYAWCVAQLVKLTETAKQERRASWRRSFVFAPNRTKNLLGARTRTLQAELFKAWGESAGVDRRVPRDVWDRAVALVSGNLLGRAFALAVSSSGLRDSGLWFETEAAGTRLLIALRRYELAHGTLPRTLDGLVPAYLEQLPNDPFGTGPMKYSADLRIVYSVGTDQVDEGGYSRPRDYSEWTLFLDHE
ncbi:MAG: hypothetical protein ACKVX7_17635 [Planctomycetota bacterium]